MIKETAKQARKLGAKKVAILATDGTIQSNVYQEALIEEGIEPVIPDENTQKLVMSIIYDDVKSGKEVTRERWNEVEDAVVALNCDYIILGCTELSVVNKNLQLEDRYIDSLIVLAETAIRSCGYEVKK